MVIVTKKKRATKTPKTQTQSQTVIIQQAPRRTARRGKVAPAKQVVVPQIIPQYIPQQISMSDIQNAIRSEIGKGVRLGGEALGTMRMPEMPVAIPPPAYTAPPAPVYTEPAAPAYEPMQVQSEIRSEIGKGVRLGGEALGSMRMPEMPMAIPPPVYTEPPVPAYEPPAPAYEPMQVQSEIRNEVRFNAEAPNEIRIEPELAHERRLSEEQEPEENPAKIRIGGKQKGELTKDYYLAEIMKYTPDAVLGAQTKVFGEDTISNSLVARGAFSKTLTKGKPESNMTLEKIKQILNELTT
jgi:hypothetical protein